MKKIAFLSLTALSLASVAYAATVASSTATLANSSTATSSSLILLPVASPVVAAPTAAPTPAAKTQSTFTIAQVASTKPAALPPLDLSDMRLWNWSGKWHASEWANGSSFTPWKFARVSKQKNGDTLFVLDSGGAPELKAQGGIGAASSGLWETEVTLPTMRDGLVVAPLWLYNDKTRDEVDFEFVGRNGLDISLHSYVGGLHMQKTVRLYKGTDFSRRKVRLGIALDQSSGLANLYVDSKLAVSINASEIGFFPKSPMKPIISMWPARSDWGNFVAWTGKWVPLPKSESLSMIVHGYGYKAFQ